MEDVSEHHVNNNNAVRAWSSAIPSVLFHGF